MSLERKESRIEVWGEKGSWQLGLGLIEIKVEMGVGRIGSEAERSD